MKDNTNSISVVKEIENRDLLFISYDNDIPSNYRGGVMFSLHIDENGRIRCDSNERTAVDPSTIYIHLPIVEEYDVSPLPYWPHYIELTPGQRFKYLNWLRNVEQPIDIGYVFLYYYGLERHLLTDNFEKAFNQIIRLRNVHKNKSFQSYTEHALIHSCIMMRRIDMLLGIHEKTDVSGFSNAQFLLAYNGKMDLGIENLLSVFYKAFTLSRKAVLEDRQMFVNSIMDSLKLEYGKETFALCDYDISKVKTKTEIRFANYSFPTEIQRVEITDFYQCKPLMADLEKLFKLSYELYKKNRAIEKKKQKLNISDEEVHLLQIKKDVARYKRLLNDKKITQEEFLLLQKFKNGDDY